MEIFEGTLGDDRTGSWVVKRSPSHLVYMTPDTSLRIKFKLGLLQKQSCFSLAKGFDDLINPKGWIGRLTFFSNAVLVALPPQGMSQLTYQFFLIKGVVMLPGEAQNRLLPDCR